MTKWIERKFAEHYLGLKAECYSQRLMRKLWSMQSMELERINRVFKT